MKKYSIFTISFIMMLVLLYGCSSANTDKVEETTQNNNSSVTTTTSVNDSEDDVDKVNAKVLRVIDGDTAVVDIGGTEESVRFLLIDASETNSKKSAPPEPYALDAKNYLASMIENKTVQLEVGSPKRDKYNRLLAWVFIDGKNVQEQLLKKGLVKIRYVYEPNTKYLDIYQKAENEAKTNKLNIWSIPGFADNGDDYNVSVVNQKTSNTMETKPKTSGECSIKGNINSKGDKIYHTQQSQWYKQTKAEKMFCTEEEAQNEGFRKAG